MQGTFSLNLSNLSYQNRWIEQDAPAFAKQMIVYAESSAITVKSSINGSPIQTGIKLFVFLYISDIHFSKILIKLGRTQVFT
ncbi:hypothetical protein BACCIP111899_04209 [Bacillus rhizoplanae]|uniref:Uncharacterized protein n=1 Tax=Bacillus rhizoplanae TaxID=2880966 RepID=A0ABM8YH16_9BACI|nr:hypothetical protein [Bacillus rhizoplanae]CAG9614975.1 hypothetical protein BACCIP111899_04209 [Bacillus rhizoplanae]